MELVEVKKNLFSVESDYYLAHCISSDFALGAGIAVQFASRGVRDALCINHKKNNWNNEGYCLFTPVDGFRGAFNLVTKPKYWNKPTYDTLRQALLDMKELVYTEFENNLSAFNDDEPLKIAMPAIGCGLDRLEWTKVKELINEIFADEYVEILVCRL